LIIIELSRNFGKEAALTAGINFLDHDACIILDADLQDPPVHIYEMVKIWKQGFEIVSLRRCNRSSDNLFKRYSSKYFYYIFNMLSDLKIPNNVGDSRLIDRCVVDSLKKLPENNRFMKGLFAWVGFNTYIIDIKRDARSIGNSKMNIFNLLLLAINAITSFSTGLLRFWMYFGFCVSVISFALGSYIFLRYLFVGVELPGYSSIAVILLFVSGIQMIGIGLIGEYIGRIYIESKHRPSYIIKKIHE
jgi:glycosyltransferase involved in cell wall biosynthesis